MREEETPQQAGVVDGFKHGLVSLEAHSALAVVTDLERLAPFYDARAGFDHSGEQVQKGGLAHSVAAYYAYLVAALELVAEVLEQWLSHPVVAQVVAVDDF